jgi:serine protease
MKLLLRLTLVLSALTALNLLSSAPATAAEPVNPPGAPDAGDVIVKFRADSQTSRKYALSARTDAAAVRSMLEGRASALGSRVGRALSAGSAVGDRIQTLRSSGMAATELAAMLAADPDVEYAVPNGRKRRSAAPNDPLYLTGPIVNATARTGGPSVGQWYLRKPVATASATATDVVSSIDIEAAWARTLGSAGVVVAVLDTGVRPEHPDLAGRLLPGYDFVSDATVANDGDGRDADPTDPGDGVTQADLNADAQLPAASRVFTGCSTTSSSWHGTGTTSLIGANTSFDSAAPGVGMAGAAPGVKLLMVRVLGKCYGSDADVQAGMRWAAGLHVDGVPDNLNKARVINMSLGGCSTSGDCSCDAAYRDTVNQIIASGTVIVAAAGNSNGGEVSPPATCPGVIGVAGLRHVGTKVGFSSLGPEVSIAAPGGNCVNLSGACLYPILQATNSGSQGPASSTWSDSYKTTLGTSFSSPLAAAVAGLMLSVNPGLSPAQVRSVLQSSARPFPARPSTSSVPLCQQPSSATQDECYCTTGTCGAGMLDAGAAVAAAASPTLLTAEVRTTVFKVVPGDSVSLDSGGSAATAPAVITARAWDIPSTPGGVTINAATGGSTSAVAQAEGRAIALATISSSSNASSVMAATSRTQCGSFEVRLTVTDSLSQQAQSAQTIAIDGPPTASIVPSTSATVPGSAVSLDGRGSSAPCGRSISSYHWALTSGSGAASLTGSTSASTASLAASAAGTAVVQLTVTDSAGKQATGTTSVTIAQAAATGTGSGSTTTGAGSGSMAGGSGSSSGGGAVSGNWLALLGLAVLALVRAKPRSA